MIGISRVQVSPPKNLFGSSIKHSNTIRIRVYKAEVERYLHQEWFFAASHIPIVEVELSAAQFAQMITTPNVGDGVPCTITYVGGKDVKDPPYYGVNELFNEELKQDIGHILIESRKLAASIEDILEKKGPIKVSEKQELLSAIEMLTQHLESNMPFLHKQYARAMNKTVSAAKAEIEEFYTQAVMKVGKAALENGIVPDKPQINFERKTIELKKK